MNSRNRIVFLILAAILALLPAAGCGLVQNSAQRELNANRAKWESSGIDDYEFHLRVGCFCPPNIVFPVVIKVQNGVAISKEFAREPKEVTTDFFDRADTIDKLFGIIQDAIDAGADNLTVEYDATYGYPMSINIDPIKTAIDEEIAYFVEAFIPAP